MQKDQFLKTLYGVFNKEALSIYVEEENVSISITYKTCNDIDENNDSLSTDTITKTFDENHKHSGYIIKHLYLGGFIEYETELLFSAEKDALFTKLFETLFTLAEENYAEGYADNECVKYLPFRSLIELKDAFSVIKVPESELNGIGHEIIKLKVEANPLETIIIDQWFSDNEDKRTDSYTVKDASGIKTYRHDSVFFKQVQDLYNLAYQASRITKAAQEV